MYNTFLKLLMNILTRKDMPYDTVIYCDLSLNKVLNDMKGCEMSVSVMLLAFNNIVNVLCRILYIVLLYTTLICVTTFPTDSFNI